jgi:hypothetical protein
VPADPTLPADPTAALEPFYLPRGDGRFLATASCLGPWFAHAQHVGPPTALLVRELERCAPREGLQLGRVTVEVLGPVPIGELEVSTVVERAGRTIELLAAEMSAAGRPVLRARAWRLATEPTGHVAGGEADPIPERPAVSTWSRPDGWLPGYLDAIEWHWLSGGLELAGDGQVWGRPRVPVVDGEEPTGLQRLATLADSANGAGARLDVDEWLFLNTEITLHVHREPVGEWIGMDAHTVIGPTGLGTVSATLYDQDGHVGRCAQELTVRPRPAG